MDLQVKLVADGYALAYESPEQPSLPEWADWKDQAYGTTAEPLAIVYNKRLVPEGEVPNSDAELLKLLDGKTDAYNGKATAYDHRTLGAGFLQLTQDTPAWPQAWDLFRAFGRAEIKLYTSVGATSNGSARASISSPIMCSARTRSHGRRRIRASAGCCRRTTHSSRRGWHSSPARRGRPTPPSCSWASAVERGQEILANQALLYAVRDDVSGVASRAGGGQGATGTDPRFAARQPQAAPAPRLPQKPLPLPPPAYSPAVNAAPSVPPWWRRRGQRKCRGSALLWNLGH